MLLTDIQFSHLHQDYHSGQHDYKLYAYLPDEAKTTLGWVDYSVFQDEVYINHIEVWDEYRDRGVGLALLKEMTTIAPWQEIHKGFLTRDGATLVESMDKWVGKQTVGGMTEEEYNRLKTYIDTGEERRISPVRTLLYPRDLEDPNIRHLTRFGDPSNIDYVMREERGYEDRWAGLLNTRGTLIGYCESIVPERVLDIVYFRYALMLELLTIAEMVEDYPNKEVWIEFFDTELSIIENELPYYIHSDPNDPALHQPIRGLDRLFETIVYSSTIDCMTLLVLLEYSFNLQKGLPPPNIPASYAVPYLDYGDLHPFSRVSNSEGPYQYSTEFYDYVIAFMDNLRDATVRAKHHLGPYEEEQI